MSSSYVVLPSSTIVPHRQNKQNDFVTPLGQPIQGENLRVRLSSISFKKSWPDLHKGNNYYYSAILPKVKYAGQHITVSTNRLRVETDAIDPKTGNKKARVHGMYSDGTKWHVDLNEHTIPEGYYENVEEIVAIMKKNNMWGYKIETLYNPKRINIRVGAGWLLIIPVKGLASVLGLRKDSADVLTPGQYKSKYPLFSQSRIQYFHVVLEGLTEPIICGDKRKAILATIPGDGEAGQVLEYYFKNNHFHKVLKNHFNNIRVQLLDKDYNPVPIVTGETILTLEFKDGSA